MEKENILDHSLIKEVSVDVLKEEVKELLVKAEEMIQFCVKNDMAMGLAAPQVGIFKNMFVMLLRNGNYQVVFNPKVFPETSKKIMVRERCFSVPDKTYLVKRYRDLRVLYHIIDESGEFVRQTKVLRNEEAVVFAHEFDHLKAISIADIGEEMSNEQK